VETSGFLQLFANGHTKNSDSLDPTADNPDGASPRHQWYVRSSLDLPMHLEQDLTVRYVDRLSKSQYTQLLSLDAQLGWKPIAHLELSVGGKTC